MRTRSMRGGWKYRGTVIVATASAVVLLLGGCSGVGNKPAVSAQATAAASSTGPLAGGVKFLEAYQLLNTAYGQVGSSINDPAGTLTVVVPAVGRLRDAQVAFDSSVGRLPFPNSVRHDVQAMLTADKAATAALNAAAAVTTADALQPALTLVGSTGHAADVAEVKVGGMLDVVTDRPTKHLAPKGMPTVIANLDAQPIAVETLSGGASASYGPSGYVQAAANGFVAERSVTDLQLANTSVLTRTVISGTGSASAALICRSTAAGTAGGQEYMLGASVDGTLFIEYIDPLGGSRYLFTGSSNAAKSGASMDLRADCIGPYLTLYLNGKPQIQVYDSQLSRGNVGLFSAGPGAAVYSTLTASGNTK